MAKVENVIVPIGWLLDPNNKWAIHFNNRKASNDQVSDDFTIDMWGVVSSGKPMKFKSRRKVTKEDSIKTWKQLVSSDWIEFDCDKNMIA